MSQAERSPQLTPAPASQGSGTPAISVTYKLDQIDLGAFYTAAAKRAENWLPVFLRSVTPIVLVSVLFLVIALALMLIPATSVLRFDPLFWISLVLGLTVVVLLVQQYKRARAFAPLPNGAVLGQKSLEVEDDGFLVTENGAQQACLWGNVLEFVETDSHLLLFVDSAAAHIVPKDAFASTTDAQRFAAICRERIYTAKSGS